MTDDTRERPVFGQPVERGGTRRSPVKGQRGLGLEGQLPPPIQERLPKALARRRSLAEVRRVEAEKTGWDEFVFNEGTRDEFRRLGRYYEIAEGLTPLGLFDIPPRTGRATRVGSLVSGDKVFVAKDSEKADDPRRKGWAEVVVLEKTEEGQKPRPRTFNDGNINRIVVRALHKGIIERQVIV